MWSWCPVSMLLVIVLALSTINPGANAASPLSKFVYSGNYTLMSIYNYTWIGFYQDKRFGLELGATLLSDLGLLGPYTREDNLTDDIFSYIAKFRAGNRISTIMNVTKGTQVTGVGMVISTRKGTRGQTRVVERFVQEVLRNITTIKLMDDSKSLQLSSPTCVMKWNRTD
jgi:hypothetical protein